jgi:hypothetical protein
MASPIVIEIANAFLVDASDVFLQNQSSKAIRRYICPSSLIATIPAEFTFIPKSDITVWEINNKPKLKNIPKIAFRDISDLIFIYQPPCILGLQ